MAIGDPAEKSCMEINLGVKDSHLRRLAPPFHRLLLGFPEAFVAMP